MKEGGEKTDEGRRGKKKDRETVSGDRRGMGGRRKEEERVERL